MTLLIRLVIAWVTLDVVLIGIMATTDASTQGRRFAAFTAAVVTLGAAAAGYLAILAVAP